VERGAVGAHAAGLAGEPQEDAIQIGSEGAMGLVGLNRPRALNALTTAMRASIASAFAGWARDPQIYAVLIRSNGGRAFCAGGDIREMAEWGKARPIDVMQSLAAEYSLNWQLECFTKPTLSLIDGLVVGSGVGITLYGTHRIAGENYRFSMPEARIGFFPDDGVGWAFSRMPDEIGMYLALTGREIGRADAYRLGLVTHCVSARRFPEIEAAVRDADPVDPVLDQCHEDPGPGELEALRPAIARCFGRSSVEEIVQALHAEAGQTAGWAAGVLADLQRCSPTSLKVTYRHVRAARDLDLSATLKQDFRLASRFMQGHDFYEGVRAGLVDRDHAPKWRPATLQEVSSATVDGYFAPLAVELDLPSRAEMQAVRT
jgi:enoyl-CoA hydratase